MRHRPNQNTSRVVVLTVAFFGGLAVLAQANGVFARLGTEVSLMLALFTLAFGVLTYHLDADVRAYVKRLFAPRANLAKQGRDPAATMW